MCGVNWIKSLKSCQVMSHENVVDLEIGQSSHDDGSEDKPTTKSSLTADKKEEPEYKRVQSWRDRKIYNDSDSDDEKHPTILSPKRDSPIKRLPSQDKPFSAPRRAPSVASNSQATPPWGIDTLNSLMNLSTQLNDVIANLSKHLNESKLPEGPPVVKISAKQLHDYKKAFEAFDTDNSGKFLIYT